MKFHKCAGVPSIVHLSKCTGASHWTSSSETSYHPIETPHGRFFIFFAHEEMGAPTKRLYDIFPNVSETQQGLCALVESHLRGEIPKGYVYSLSEFQKVKINSVVFYEHDIQLDFFEEV